MQDLLRKSCLICQSNKIQDIIDLGIHPFADKFIKENDKYLDEKIFPLVVCLCQNCGNIQQKIITKPEARYSDSEYSYTSSNSKYSRLYWKCFANHVVKIKSGINRFKGILKDGFQQLESIITELSNDTTLLK